MNIDLEVNNILMSTKLIHRSALVLSLIGLINAAYLTWIKIINSEASCGIGGCDVVNSSIYSEVAGIPVALLGAGAFACIIALFLLENKADFWVENAPTFLFGITFIGLLYSIYLTYLELFVIHAICPYCVVSAIIMLILFILVVIKNRQEQGA